MSDNDEQPSIKNLKIINYLLSMDEESEVMIQAISLYDIDAATRCHFKKYSDIIISI